MRIDLVAILARSSKQLSPDIVRKSLIKIFLFEHKRTIISIKSTWVDQETPSEWSKRKSVHQKCKFDKIESKRELINWNSPKFWLCFVDLWRVDDDTDSYTETPNVDNFGVSFIFERALRRLDVHAEQRKLQKDKFDSHLKKYENDIQVLELKLSNKIKDFDKLHDKFKALQVKEQII